ncbi:hypothetical protein D3C76_346560 [compost metagenome]
MKSSSSQGGTVSLPLLVVTAQWAARHLLAILPEQDADLAWYALDVLRAVGMSAAFGLCVTLTPWRMLQLKCLLAAFCGYYISDSIICATWYAFGWPDPVIAAIIQGLGFSAVGLIYLARSYEQPSDGLEAGYLYCVRRIPAGAQDFAISLACAYGPDGGYSLYANGYLYKYACGRLVRRKVSSLPSISYHVQRGARTTPELIRSLDELVGARWTWRRNCLTILAPIWRRHSG